MSVAALRPAGLFVAGPCTLAVAGRLFGGHVEQVEGQSVGALLRFVVDPIHSGTPVPGVGTEVRLRLPGARHFDSKAELVGLQGSGVWMLSCPVRLRSRQMRLSPRIPSRGDWHLLSRHGARWEVFDVSLDGVGIRFPATFADRAHRLRLQGTLQGPKDSRWTVRLQATNHRPAPGSPGQIVVGFKMQLSDELARHRLGRVLGGR